MSILDSDTHSLQGSPLAILFLSVGAFKQCMSEGCILIQKYFLSFVYLFLFISLVPNSPPCFIQLENVHIQQVIHKLN